MPTGRSLKLVAVGVLAGVFSGVFGVGGGTVIVPLLIFGLAYGERLATGTSLAAIVVTAAAGAGTQALYGNVHVGKGLLIGIPAVGGVLVGTWLQQRLRIQFLRLLFAALLIAVALDLLLK